MDNGKAPSLTDDLFLKLRARIHSGEMPPGSRFPTQKDIALTANVSRTVVREAVARLEAQGLAVSRQGSGVFVTETARYQAFQVTREELGQLADIVRLLEMRLAVETEMSALAAERRTAKDLAAMRAKLSAIAAAGDDVDAAAQADAAFHVTIAEATGNAYFSRFMDFLGIRLVPPRTLLLRGRSSEAHQAYAATIRAEHEAILAAIEAQDQTAARDAARHHMEQSRQRHADLGAAAAAGEES
jgi:GntR family transcriptional regulator, transcriptional repressor for pyruvate dehydrogenase complex